MEIWKPIPSLDAIYEASNLGRLRRAVPGQATHVGHVIKPSLMRGYERCSVHMRGVQMTRSIHRLVVEAFLGPIPPGMHVNHRNGNKADNRIENLEICTASENTRHGFRVLGRAAPIHPNPGEKNGRAKLRNADMPTIFSMRAQGLSQQKIADHFSVSQSVISKVLLGLTGFTR